MTTNEQENDDKAYRAELAKVAWKMMSKAKDHSALTVLEGRAMERDRLKLHTEQAQWEKRRLNDVAPNIEAVFTAAATYIEAGLASPFSLYRLRAALKLAEMNRDPNFNRAEYDYTAYSLAYYGPDRDAVSLEQLAKLMEDN